MALDVIDRAASAWPGASRQRVRSMLRVAVHKLGRLGHVLQSRKARRVPAALRDELRAAVAAIAGDARMLVKTPACGDSMD